MANSFIKQTRNTVLGKITDAAGRPLANLKVTLYDVDMRSWQSLAETITNTDGSYELIWSSEKFKDTGVKTADIALTVATAEKGTELYKTPMSDVRFNASSREEINIIIRQSLPREVIEFDDLTRQVTYLASGIAIADLQESKENNDITFLSKELDQPFNRIEQLIVAHRLQNQTKINAAFFYGLFRENTLQQNDLTQRLNARLSINISADDETLLYDIALTPAERIEAGIKSAVTDSIIAVEEADNLKRYEEIIARYREKGEAYYATEHPKKLIQLISRYTNAEKLKEISSLFQENRNNLDTFFDKLLDPSFFTSADHASNAATTLALTKLFGLGSEVLSGIAASKGIRQPEDIRNLAKLNKAALVQEITSAPSNTLSSNAAGSMASVIVRRLEKEYPTTAFAAQLERAKEPVLKNQDKIVAFFNNHPDFELTTQNVDSYLKDKQVTAADSEAISEELKSVQRIFKLVPQYSKTLALRNAQIHSSQSIVAVGEKRFVAEIAPKAGIEAAEAKTIYRKAQTRHEAALLLAGSLQDSMSVLDIASFETTELAKKLEAVSKDFPNLQSLFQVTDTCECEHCRSVYSPAAYLVEILQFLDKRAVIAGNAKSILFGRRPELGEIDLGCENANTPVKYIDLVCEILEEAILPDAGISYSGALYTAPDKTISGTLFTALTNAGLPVTANALIFTTESQPLAAHYLRDKNLVCKIENTGGTDYLIYRLRQTFATAEELDAAPEYVNTAVYEQKLNKASFVFSLPFHLSHTEASAYFARFDIDRADLMQSFQKAGTPSDEAIAAERLGLTDKESALIFTVPLTNDNTAQQTFWNVPAPGDVVDYLKQVDHFLDKAGISYQTLDILLQLPFIDPAGKLFIKHNTLGCDTAQKVINNLDLDALDRLHRLLRLQKKTGWKPEILDQLIAQATSGGQQLNTACLLRMARLKEITQQTGIKTEELMGCFGTIPHLVIASSDTLPLYHQLFLNKAKNGTVDDGMQPEKIDGSQALSSYLGYIATCLQVKQKDLALLTPLLPDDKLTFASLSFLLASTRLLKKLKLTASDLTILFRLSGINYTTSPEKMLAFITLVKNLTASPLKTADVLYLLKHEATNISSRAITTEKTDGLLTTLKTEYTRIDNQYASSYNDQLSVEELQGTTLQVLTGLANVTEDDAKTILSFCNKDWSAVTDATGAKNFINVRFDQNIVRLDINAAIDAIDTGADPADDAKKFIKALLDAIATFEIQTARQTFAAQTIATAFKADPDITGSLLQQASLKQTAPGTDKLVTLLTADISATSYPGQSGAIKLLQKMLIVTDAFQLSSTTLAWYLQHNPTLGSFEFDRIPYESSGQTAVPLDKYITFLQMVTYAQQYTAVANPADASQPVTFFSVMEAALQTPAINRTVWINLFALLTGYDPELTDDIDAYLYTPFNTANYQHTAVWDQLLNGAAMARKLGATTAQINRYIQPELTSAEVNDLRATLKPRYDEDTWLSTLKEISDAIRPQKRNALVAYLLAINPDIKDTNDLYEYFLVDVQMESKIPSSRIVLAHNSVQLFVQRCLMGLEPDAIADTTRDPAWNQWQWMKNYRVWEANRKVFLYPENWYDVTLTDDKTYLLTEFINELQQNDLTNDTAEEALKQYLEKLDTIAFLEVMATWYDVPARDMHVFARTKGGDPAIYYYRRFENERYWTPWEKVELDISGDHLVAFIRNNRLHLAWPLFTEEAAPEQQSTIPDSEAGSSFTNDKPKKRLKVQLAISEYANKKWQPKKVSNDALYNPARSYTDDESNFKKDIYILKYFAWPKIQNFPVSEVICFFQEKADGDYSVQVLCGVFNIAGCKGYPEMIDLGKLLSVLDKDQIVLPDFLPDFQDTALLNQRYVEQNNDSEDVLAARNGISILYSGEYFDILKATPGTFRISYPHQFTLIDCVVLLFEVIFQALNSSGSTAESSYSMARRALYKIPQGTLLPYFMEDSGHAYAIIPGYYKKDKKAGTFTDADKRTASDVFQLMDDINNWYKKINLELAANSGATDEEKTQIIISDDDFQNLLTEISHYINIDAYLKALADVNKDEAAGVFLKELIKQTPLHYGEQFKNLYHPLVCYLRSILYQDGVPSLMDRDTQLKQTAFDFASYYTPNAAIVPKTFFRQPDGSSVASYPVEDIDFSSDGSYSVYNWDLFYRLPLHIATSLTRNQRFEEALTWFHYMFNPTGALSGTGAQKYWVTKPFYLNQKTDYIIQRIDTLLYATSDPNNPNVPAGAASDPAIRDLEFAISEWRNKPFRPDVVMRYRPVAYQKALLMKYIDNLTQWGDYLFRQDTMESIAQATQMYILADKLLGPKPRIVPAAIPQPYETYNQIEAKLDSMGNALIELENILPDISVLPEKGEELPASLTLSMLYFCIPPNENMAAYWDTVADRLFKIRNSQNIDGVERSLSLFAPPIDPGMLVRAAAAGLDLSSVIAGLNAPTPYYRFNTLSQKAAELAQEVRGLGSGLLQALEKKDAEAFSLLRNELELKLLNAVTDIKKTQLREATAQLEVLNRTRKVTEERKNYYAAIQKIITQEQLSLDLLQASQGEQESAQNTNILASVLGYLPNITIGASGFGGSPHVNVQWGTGNIISALQAVAQSHSLNASMLTYQGNRSSTLAGYERRYEDWKLQERVADKELDSIDAQITAAGIRIELAETELKNHAIQIDNSQQMDAFMRTKYTNKELYDWMIGQISGVYFQAYQLAYDFARKAERCYQFELGIQDSFITGGYWDSMKKGLQSADRLVHDIKRMETAYLDKNKREYEITRHVSLAQLNPLALINLRATGSCDFDIPEVLYDLDHAGHYFRRLKSVSISIPCVAGPYTSVSARLSLVSNKYRKNTNAPGNYVEDTGNDDRFVYNVGAIQSIATSSGLNDSGVFELNFRDDRYLPFENTGAISSWRLEMPATIRQFDYDTIADVIIHVKYTAREGGSVLKNAAVDQLQLQLDAIKQDLNQTGLHVALNMKHDLPNEWYLFKKNSAINLLLNKGRLPYLAQTLSTVAIESVLFIAKVKGNPASFSLVLDDAADATELSRIDALQLCSGSSPDIALDTAFKLAGSTADIGNLEELLLVIHYTVS